MDQEYMAMALALAAKGRGFTSPNPMVGALVVKDGRVVGKGYHEMVGGHHAEVNAINDAGHFAKDADLYVTLEPCNHKGRTPPCTEKIIASGIKRVVVAMADPNPHVAGGGNRYLIQKGVKVVTGVCRREAQNLNAAFVKHVKTGRPYVMLKWAATLDGRIAAKTGDARWITNEKSRHFVHQMRHYADGIMVGIGTVKADNPSLTTRLPGLINGKEGKNPIRIIVDSHLAIDPDVNVVRTALQTKTIVVAGDISKDSALQEKKDLLIKNGVEVMEMPLIKGRIDLVRLMARLGAMNITSLLIEGGAGLAASSLDARVVDRLMMFYAPKLYGGDDGVPILKGSGQDRMSDCLRLKNIKIKRFGDDVMIQADTDDAVG